MPIDGAPSVDVDTFIAAHAAKLPEPVEGRDRRRYIAHRALTALVEKRLVIVEAGKILLVEQQEAQNIVEQKPHVIDSADDLI